MKKIILTFILFLFLSSTLCAGAFLISGGAFSHTYPVAAFNGANYQTAWVDKRYSSSYYAFWGKQVSSDGTPIGTDTEIEAYHYYLSFMPDMCTNGNNCLLVWERYRAAYGPGDAYGILIDRDGNPIGSKFRISIGNTVNANFPHGDFDGTNYLLVWQLGTPNNGCKIQGQFVSQTGTLVGSNFDIRPVGMATGVDQIYPAVKFNGTNYLVVWDDDRTGSRDIYGQLVGTDGSMVGSDFPISTAGNDQMLVDLAWSGSGFCAVWQDDRWDTNDASIFGQLVNANGTLNGDNFCIYEAPGDSGCGWPSVASSGDSYLAGWHKEFLVYDESPLDETQIFIREAAGVDITRPVVWYDVQAQKISLTGGLVDPTIDVCVEQYHQDQVYITSDGDDYLMVWEDSRNGNQYYVVYGAIIDDIPVSVDDPIVYNRIVISPNPSSQHINVKFSMPTSQKIALELYNVKGQKITSFHDGIISAGTHELIFETNVPSGIYFMKMQTGSDVYMEKFLILN